MDLTQIPAEILQAERTLSEWFAQRNLSGWKLGGSQERVDEPAAGFTPCRLCRQIQRTVGWECSGQCNGEPK